MEAQLSQSLTMKFLMLISQPVIVFDRDGHAVWSNNAAKALFDQSTRIRDSYLHQLASVNLEQVQAAPEQEGVIATVLHSAPNYEKCCISHSVISPGRQTSLLFFDHVV